MRLANPSQSPIHPQPAPQNRSRDVVVGLYRDDFARGGAPPRLHGSGGQPPLATYGGSMECPALPERRCPGAVERIRTAITEELSGCGERAAKSVPTKLSQYSHGTARLGRASTTPQIQPHITAGRTQGKPRQGQGHAQIYDLLPKPRAFVKSVTTTLATHCRPGNGSGRLGCDVLGRRSDTAGAGSHCSSTPTIYGLDFRLGDRRQRRTAGGAADRRRRHQDRHLQTTIVLPSAWRVEDHE
jgi:hypothetical protein